MCQLYDTRKKNNNKSALQLLMSQVCAGQVNHVPLDISNIRYWSKVNHLNLNRTWVYVQHYCATQLCLVMKGQASAAAYLSSFVNHDNHDNCSTVRTSKLRSYTYCSTLRMYCSGVRPNSLPAMVKDTSGSSDSLSQSTTA